MKKIIIDLKILFLLVFAAQFFANVALAIDIKPHKITEESIVLLKNQDNLLPLKLSGLKSIAVIGPNANQVQYGDYSVTKYNSSGVTILEGINNIAKGNIQVNYAKGCGITALDNSGFKEAVTAAEKSYVVVLVIGGTSMSLSGVGWTGFINAFTDMTPAGMQRYNEHVNLGENASSQFYSNRGGPIVTKDPLKVSQVNGHYDDDAIFPIHKANYGGQRESIGKKSKNKKINPGYSIWFSDHIRLFSALTENSDNHVIRNILDYI